MVASTIGGNMNRIDVVPAEDGKFKVLHNFIQHGISYSTKELAEQEANKLKEKFYPKANKTA